MIYLGFDPGGLKGFGVALYDTDVGLIVGQVVSSVDEAVDWARAECRSTPAAAGIDTLLFWQSTPSGWRGADEFLRQRYPECSRSVVSSNGLYGSMSVQGAVLAGRLRERWPEIWLTETHPKVLWSALGLNRAYPRNLEDRAAVDIWSKRVGIGHVRVGDEHQFDAALSAWAAERGHGGFWTRDLSQIRAAKQKLGNVSVVSDVHYCWPD